MKINTTIFLFLIFIFSFSIYGQETENDLQAINVFGNVKSIKTLKYNAHDSLGITVKEKKYQNKYNFKLEVNEAGYFTKQIGYNKDNKPFTKATFKYDEKGNKMELTEFNYKGRMTDRLTKAYDKNNNLILETNIDFYKNGSKTGVLKRYTYNSQNQIIETLKTSLNNVPYKKTVCNYNLNDSLIKQTIEYNDEILDYKTLEYIDKKNNNKIVVKEFYDENLKLSEKNKTIYNSKKRILKKVQINSLGEIDSETLYSYDKYGNVTKSSHNSSYGKGEDIYVYEYDSKNNWIKKTSYRKNKPFAVTERIYEYY